MAPSIMHGDTITPDGFGESNYEVFDPLNWMLDGLVDLPITMGGNVPDMEVQGMV